MSSQSTKTRGGIVVLLFLCSLLLVQAAQYDTCFGPDQIEKYLVYGTEFKLDDRVENVHLSVVLDKSQSMRGSRLVEAKQASISLVDALNKNDKMQIIAFDQNAELVQELTNDKIRLKTAIESIIVGDRTSYNPALKLAWTQYNGESENSARVIVFLSDGNPDDEGMPDSILDMTKEIISEGICIFTINYGSTDTQEAQVILRTMARMSEQALGCGKYFSSDSNKMNLNEVFGQIYSEVIADDTINIEIEQEYKQGALVVDAKLSSSFNNNNIPGFITYSACMAEPKVVVKIKQGDQIIKTTQLIYDEKLKKFRGYLYSISNGKYTLQVDAQIDCEDNLCHYGGKEENNIEITGEKICMNSWDLIESYIVGSYEETTYIDIYDDHFEPSFLNIKRGQSVIWKNKGKNINNVISGAQTSDGLFDSGPLVSGETFKYTFGTEKEIRFFSNYTNYFGARGNVTGQEIISTANNVEMTLIIDTSGSMKGSKLEEAKIASENLVNILRKNDRCSIIAFDDDAKLEQQFTSDPQKIVQNIDRLVAGESTLYLPALRLANLNYHSSYSNPQALKVIIFLSDGRLQDKGGAQSVLEEVKNMVEENICLYTIGYGTELYYDKQASALLNAMAEFSRKSIQCGKYFFSFERSEILTKIFGEIYIGITKGEELLLNVTGVEEFYKEDQAHNLSMSITSKYNGISIPSVSGDMCVYPAEAKLEIRDMKNNIMSIHEFMYNEKTQKYELTFTPPKGKYIFSIIAGIYSHEDASQFRGEYKWEAEVKSKSMMFVQTKLFNNIMFLVVALAIILLIVLVNIQNLKERNERRKK